jgi:hypothetical protein
MNSATKLAAQAFLAALLLAAAAPAAHATDYHWIGAGTGGNTVTDPLEPTTQWNNPANWQEGQVPTSTDKALLPLANAGYVNAQSAVLSGLGVDGPSADGAYHIADGADVSTPTNHGVNVGLYAQGRVLQTGGSLTVGGWLRVGAGAGGNGTYLLEGGALNALTQEYIAYNGTGTFTQTGGTHTVGGELAVGQGGGPTAPITGVLNVGGGVLQVGTLYVYTTGTLNVTNPTAYIEVHALRFAGKSSLTVLPGCAIHVVGTIFEVNSQDELALRGLEDLTVVFDGTWSGLGGSVEVAGKDLGASPAGFNDNFALGSLVIGGAVPRNIWLQDIIDNGNRASPEALYVHDLTIAVGSSLDLAGLHLYYDGAFGNQGSVLGGSPIFVPEPATLGILAIGLTSLLLKPLRKSRAKPAR